MQRISHKCQIEPFEREQSRRGRWSKTGLSSNCIVADRINSTWGIVIGQGLHEELHLLVEGVLGASKVRREEKET